MEKFQHGYAGTYAQGRCTSLIICVILTTTSTLRATQEGDISSRKILIQ